VNSGSQRTLTLPFDDLVTTNVAHRLFDADVVTASGRGSIDEVEFIVTCQGDRP
jgi:hypothetical protein